MAQRTQRSWRPGHRVASAQYRSVPALRISYRSAHFHCQARGSELEAGHGRWRYRDKPKPVTNSFIHPIKLRKWNLANTFAQLNIDTIGIGAMQEKWSML